MTPIDKGQAWSLFKTLLLIRKTEEKIVELYPLGQMKTPVHLCLGQEACAVGVCAALSKKDAVFSTHRCHGHYLAKGGDLKAFFAELFGKSAGCSKGKGGSMHLCWPETVFIGSSAIVGGSIPMAAGAAWSFKLLRKPEISVAFFGDGACDEGVFWETVNFASLKKLPILFVCENNLYATNSHVRARQAGESLSAKVASFGITSLNTDGNDVEKVFSTASSMIENIRAGGGPAFLELPTYRLLGHVGTKPDARPESELLPWIEKCPVRLAEKWQRELGRTEEEFHSLSVEINQLIADSVDFAQKCSVPDISELLDDVREA